MALPGPTPEEQAKCDAWVAAIRQLARIHNVAHKQAINSAIKAARVETTLAATLVTLPGYAHGSTYYAIEAGIPEDEVRGVRALIYG